MSVRLITILSCFTIFVILHNSLILAYPYPEYLLQSQDDDIFQNEDTPQSWGNIEQPIETPSKRDCAGFPCMYTHLSAKAGRASLYRKLARLIDDCISDLNCNPGGYMCYFCPREATADSVLAHTLLCHNEVGKTFSIRHRQLGEKLGTTVLHFWGRRKRSITSALELLTVSQQS